MIMKYVQDDSLKNCLKDIQAKYAADFPPEQTASDAWTINHEA